MNTETKGAEAKPNPMQVLPALDEQYGHLTGEDTRVPKLQVPSIKVSYKDYSEKEEDCDEGAVPGEKRGEFVEWNPAKDMSVALGPKIEVTILHHRHALGSYTENEQMYTPEQSMKQRVFPLFATRTQADGQRKTSFIRSAEMKVLREEFQNLGYRRILYVVHDGQLKRLQLKGANFGGFLDLTKVLDGASSTSRVLELTTKKAKKGNVTYYPIVFTPKDPTDMGIVKPWLEELSRWFEQYDKLIQEQQDTRQAEAAVERGDGPDDTAEKGLFKDGVSATADEPTPEDEAKAEELFGKEEGVKE